MSQDELALIPEALQPITGYLDPLVEWAQRHNAELSRLPGIRQSATRVRCRYCSMPTPGDDFQPVGCASCKDGYTLAKAGR